jgi:voltage-gated potassium channel
MSKETQNNIEPSTLKQRLYTIIFEADTKAGKRFDVILLWLILLSVLVVMAESVTTLHQKYSTLLRIAEWAFTIIFTIEYVIRIYVSPKPIKYILSFWGLVDLLSTLPTYFSLFYRSARYLLVIRSFRLMRIFRVLRLTQYLNEAKQLTHALKNSGAKIIVFFGVILGVVIFMGTLMYIIEGPEHGYTSIPRGIYWAIVTLTTVGYGDITPQTVVGQFLSSILMILGYAVIAVPTGIVTVEMSNIKKERECIRCGNFINDSNARYCKICSEPLNNINNE